jgi:hypothetical protein
MTDVKPGTLHLMSKHHINEAPSEDVGIAQWHTPERIYDYPVGYFQSFQ